MRSITSVHLPEAAALAAANKRVANILAKEAAPEGAVVEANLVEDAEKALFAELAKITPVVEPLFAAKDYYCCVVCTWLPFVRQCGCVL